MSSSLGDIRNQATSIVVGTLGPGLVIDVDSVVRGNAALGPRKVNAAPGQSPDASGRVVAFLDKNDTFRWVGNLAAGTAIETGVLRLSGFFDFNAHLVTPGTMTLAQLKGYLATGTLAQTFAGSVVVEDPATGSLLPSGKTFTFARDAIADKTTAFAGLHGACLGNPWVHGFDWGPSVLLSETCPAPTGKASGASRRLELEGRVTGVDATGAITIDFTPTDPFLDATDFATFMNDPSIATVKRLVELGLPDGTTWTWEMGAALVDPRGKRRAPAGFSARTQTTNNVTTFTQTYEFQGATVILTPRTSGPMSGGGEAATIVTRIDGHGYAACVFQQTGKPDQTCTLGRGRSQFVRR